MADKHLLIVDKIPTDEEFLSEKWTSRLDYVGLVKNDGGGVNTNEVFYNFVPKNVTKLKVKIDKPNNYGLGYINSWMGAGISKDKPTIIDWGNGTKTTLTTPITNKTQTNNSSDYYAYYSEPGEYEISISGWYTYFKCYDSEIRKPDVRQINEVLTEVIQVSSLIRSFDSVFRGCSNLTKISDGLFDNNTGINSFYCTFSGCSSLTSIPDGLFDKNIKVINFGDIFSGCSSLTNIPTGLFDKNVDVINFAYAFYNCSNLTSIPSGLFDNNTSVTSFTGTFAGCSGLEGETPYTWSSDDRTKIKLWDRDGTNGFTKPTKTGRTFNSCTKLTDFANIPDDWK